MPLCALLQAGSYSYALPGCALRDTCCGPAWLAGLHNDFLWAKILLLHAENLFIDFGAES
jgi:hypothetical protein